MPHRVDLKDLKTRLSLAQNKIEIRKKHHHRSTAAGDGEKWKYATNEIAYEEDDDGEDRVRDGGGGTISTDTSRESCFKCVESALQVPRANKTFTQLQVRDIERNNALLMKRIISNNRKPSEYLRPAATIPNSVASSLVNRKKQQQHIERENKRLLQQIQTAKAFGQSKRKM